MSEQASVVPDITPMPEMYYTNKRGKRITVTATEHSKNRFYQRWKKLYTDSTLTKAELNEDFARRFMRCNLVTNLRHQDKVRMERHGKDTLYFRTDGFTFIVQNGVIVTVELSDDDMRHLNKRGGQYVWK